MRLALISDIHANAEALESLSGDLAEADRVICLGDIVGYYCQVNEVIDRLRALDALCILGNHDGFLLRGCPPGAPEAVRFGIEVADRAITPDNRRWLAGLPLVWGGYCGELSLLCAHGSPWRPLEDYLYADSPALAELGAFAYDALAFGQTHRALVDSERRPRLLNPGSVGQSRDRKASACALVVDTASMAITQIARPFDPGPVIRLAQKAGARDWILKHLV